MQRLLAAVWAALLVSLAPLPAVDTEQALSDAAGAVAYASLAKASPVPPVPPQPAKIQAPIAAATAPPAEAEEIVVTGSISTSDGKTVHSEGIAAPAATATPASPLGRPTFSYQRAPAVYYAWPQQPPALYPNPAPANYGRSFRPFRWRQ